MNDMSDRAAAVPPLEVAMLAFPAMTLLDLVGPQATWGHHARTHIVWETMDPLVTDTGVTVVPTATFATCPRSVDILFVPGGFGTWDVVANPAALEFLRSRAEGARYVTSVCTGSLILAAAGLLDGYRAATHWATYDMLRELGVEGAHERVVVDRNRITGGGVTAGIDFGLTVLAALRGEVVARTTQLMLEYDPAPPFDAGSPERAGAELTAMVRGMLAQDVETSGMAAIRAIQRQRLETLRG